MAAKLSRPFRTAIKTWRTLCDWPMFDLVEDAASKMRSADIDSLRGRLTSATCNFSQHLATQRGACLAQIWVPDSQANGPVTLHTQVGACRTPGSDRNPWSCACYLRGSLCTVQRYGLIFLGCTASVLYHQYKGCCAHRGNAASSATAAPAHLTVFVCSR